MSEHPPVWTRPIPKQTLGTLQGTYHVKAGFSLFIPVAAVFFLFLFGLLTFVGLQCGSHIKC
jgi:hypothetical protein